MSEPVIRRRPMVADPLPDLHPVVARALAARGIDDPALLDPSLQHLPVPEMADMEAATERLCAALRQGERILVAGDFDADGATSVALVVRVLRAFGHEAVEYLVPNRFEFGYGLTPELVEMAAERKPDLIVTVDNGVASHEGVAAANARGIDVVVTDHHLPGPDLPPAVAIVNPNRADCPFPCKSLAGVGVAFYLLAALRIRLEAEGWFGSAERGPSMADYLDLVALGTVADVVPLDRSNRILVEQGLRRMRAGRACAGVVALLRAAGRDPARVAAADLGYAVGPRLNAAGRLADMALGIETLLADDPGAAGQAAQRLEALNRERRAIEAEMKAQAVIELDRLRDTLERDAHLPPGLVLHDDRWHQGVIGILAGRVREAVHRPTVILANGSEEGLLKGSARSIPDLHIRDVLAAIDAAQPGLMVRFGGHAMAAGLTLDPGRIEAFRAAFTHEVNRALGGVSPVREILTDGELAGDDLTLETAEALRNAGPWGAGFPEPTFEGEFRVLDHRIVGEHHLKLTVGTRDGAATCEAIAFNAAPAVRENPGRSARLVYRLDVNEFRGRRTPQLVVEHLQPLR